MAQSSTFQPHINGMRAVAILGVVLYHLNSRYCPAGYFGVDVFLVISGYFLFGKLMQTSGADRFRYGDYLVGKAKRMLPSLWALLVVVYAIIVLLLTGQPSKDGLRTCGYFGAEIAVLLFCTTAVLAFPRLRAILPRWGGWLAMVAAAVVLVFTVCPGGYATSFRYNSLLTFDFRLDESGDYFSPLTQENPLLHLWYMGVICRLYVLAPLLVIPFIRKGGKLVAGVVLGVVAAVSLLLWVGTTTALLDPDEQYRVLRFFQTHNSYYHLLPRLWEIIAGCAIFLLPDCRNVRLRNLVGVLGMLGIILCFFLFPKGSACSYPAVVLALLVMKYGSSGWCGRLLARKPVQFIGTISFSLYLWHWPVMAVYKYFTCGEVSVWDELAMVAISFLLAWLAWRFVEKCCGKKKTGQEPCKRRWFKTAGLFLLAGVSCAAGATRGLVKRADDAMLERACAQCCLSFPTNAARPQTAEELPPERLVQDFPAGVFNNPVIYLGEDANVEPSFFLMGDSHANQFNHGLHVAASAHGLRGVSLNNSVAPVWYYEPVGRGKSDAQWNETMANAVMDYLAAHPSIRYVFISLSWVRAGGTGEDWRTRRLLPRGYFMEGLEETCRRLIAMGKQVILVANTPRFKSPGPAMEWARRFKATGRGPLVHYTTTAEHYRCAQPLNDQLTPLLERHSVRAVIDPAPPLLKLTPHGCPTIYNGAFTFWDHHHFTPEFSVIASEYLLQELLRITAEDTAAAAHP